MSYLDAYGPRLARGLFLTLVSEFLIVGSQNFHYSAYGRGTGLFEYSLGTNDLQAVEDYQRLFEYQWQQAAQR